MKLSSYNQQNQMPKISSNIYKFNVNIILDVYLKYNMAETDTASMK